MVLESLRCHRVVGIYIQQNGASEDGCLEVILVVEASVPGVEVCVAEELVVTARNRKASVSQSRDLQRVEVLLAQQPSRPARCCDQSTSSRMKEPSYHPTWQRFGCGRDAPFRSAVWLLCWVSCTRPVAVIMRRLQFPWNHFAATPRLEASMIHGDEGNIDEGKGRVVRRGVC